MIERITMDATRTFVVDARFTGSNVVDVFVRRCSLFIVELDRYGVEIVGFAGLLLRKLCDIFDTDFDFYTRFRGVSRIVYCCVHRKVDAHLFGGLKVDTWDMCWSSCVDWNSSKPSV